MEILVGAIGLIATGLLFYYFIILTKGDEQ